MKVAAIQMVSCTRVDDNLRAAHALLSEAARGGAELAVLPEYFCVMGQRDTDKLALQEPLGTGPIQDWLAATARELGLWIVGGTLPLSCAPGGGAAREAAEREGKCRNASLAFNPQGDRVACYDKIHLFKFDDGSRVYDEAAVLVPGATPALFDLPSRDGHVWRLGLSICYDLRFPELYRAYAADGADLLLVPSAFTHVTGQAHWEVLLRARAVENLCGVVAAAQGGTHENGRRTWGHSMVVDAWGQVLAQQTGGAGVALAELDFAELAARRARLPALAHRVM
ncbi:carbon-nitrogen hydrolase family protein [Ottowia testudinis]|uniref:Carbon-nitrogen hydrolase family protein n=1 Tax=Ottowia testudinis TaxID=2816950 RepID=A0A975H3S6_9BURK|nr:carbon-nitrogen hydrolase family protein [Ottowia testudinis]QTD45600.1 carbon-nitrogen hydrolase family protein [Ottowia testudinis]